MAPLTEGEGEDLFHEVVGDDGVLLAALPGQVLNLNVSLLLGPDGVGLGVHLGRVLGRKAQGVLT
jgi:hypothetical protein